LQAAINAGLSTGDWGPASMLITDLHRELQDACIPALDFALVNTYANDSKVAAFIRKMLALAKLTAFRQSNSANAAEFLANAGLIHLYRQNDLAAAQNERQTMRLLIFDLHGKLVRTLIDGELPSGEHTISWDGRLVVFGCNARDKFSFPVED
jgi:hypothetical protein